MNRRGNEATLVTGAASGLGLGIARRLAADGATVIGLDREVPAGEMPGPFHRVELDDPDATAAALREVCGAHRITRLVNALEEPEPSPLTDVTLEGLAQAASIQWRVPLQCVQAASPAMTAAGFGRVVNIGSRSALGHEGCSIYASMKGGIHTITRTWALEFAQRGITVNAVGLGMMEDDASGEDAASRMLRNSIAMARPGRAEDVAQAVAFFLDERSGYVTGQLLYVCGGLSIGGLVAA